MSAMTNNVLQSLTLLRRLNHKLCMAQLSLSWCESNLRTKYTSHHMGSAYPIEGGILVLRCMEMLRRVFEIQVTMRKLSEMPEMPSLPPRPQIEIAQDDQSTSRACFEDTSHSVYHS